MENNINAIVIDKNEFTIEDAREATKSLFGVQVEDFYALKNEKWYKHLLNAVTFGSNRKKKVIKDIRTLSKLQSIFMHVYYNNYKDMDSKLNEVISSLEETNQVVKKLYVSCVIGIQSKEKLESLSEIESSILLLALSEYEARDEMEVSKLKAYRANIANALGCGLPQGKFKSEHFEKVNASEIVFQCMAEAAMLCGIMDVPSMPAIIKLAIDDLNISANKKVKIFEHVKNEVECFGIDYLYEQYDKTNLENLIDEDVVIGEKSCEIYDDINENASPEKTRVSLRAAREVFDKYLGTNRLLSDHYIVVETEKDDKYRWMIVQKESAEMTEYYVKAHMSKLRQTAIIHDYLFFFEESQICRLNLVSLAKEVIADFGHSFVDDGTYGAPYLSSFADKYMSFYYSGKGRDDEYRGDWLLDIESKKIFKTDEKFKNKKEGYFLDDRYITYVEYSKSINSKVEEVWYRLAEYIPDNDKVCTLTDSFGKHKEKSEAGWSDFVKSTDWYVSILSIVDNVAAVLVSESEMRLLKGLVTKCDFDKTKGILYTFDISKGKRISELELGEIGSYKTYSHYMVYVDCQKQWSLNIVDLLTGEKKRIAKNYKENDRNGVFMSVVSDVYAILDEWIYYKKDGASGRELVSIDDFMA